MNNELFKIYLDEVNKLEEESEKKRFKKTKNKFKLDIMEVVMIVALLSFGIITLWNIALEIVSKLKY